MQKVLKAINALRINKTPESKEMYLLLTEAYEEVKNDATNMTMFLRNLFFIMSIQRDHYIYDDLGIKKGQKIGSQEFISSRIILIWLLSNVGKWTRKNLNLFFEYSGWKLLFYNRITTTKGSAKKPSKMVSHETTMIELETLSDLVVAMIKRKNPTLSLMAKWMPKYHTSNMRTRKHVVGTNVLAGDFTFKKDIKLNGKLIKKGNKVKTKIGDVIISKGPIRKETQVKRNIDREFIDILCAKLGWSLKDYSKFRSKHLSMTPEHLFSTGKIRDFSKMDFFKWLNQCSSGQQFVVARRLTIKEEGVLKPDPKWGNFGKFYIEWDTKENTTAAHNRVALATLDSMEPVKLKKANIKTTGIQTIDLLADLFNSRLTETQVNTLHTTLMTRIDMDIPVFVNIDGSGSMLSPMGSRTWAGMSIDARYKHLRYLDVACTLAITFLMKNPNPKFRETFAWFSKEAFIAEYANFVNPNADSFLHRKIQHTPQPYKILDFKKPFTHNLASIKGANPMTACATNLGATIDLMMSLNIDPEELPQILLFITDKENVQCHRKAA